MTAPRVRPSPLLAVLVAALLAGCSTGGSTFIPPNSPGNGSGGDTTFFAGFVLDATRSGRLDVAIATASLAPALRPPLAPGAAVPIVPARGTLRWSGGTVTLTGNYDTSVDTLRLTASGWELRGTRSGVGAGSILGDATTPAGPAGFLVAGGAVPWCGTFRASAGPDSGSFCFVRADTAFAGMAFQRGAIAALHFAGTVSKSGSPRTLLFEKTLTGLYDASGSGTIDDTAGTSGGSYLFDITNPAYGTTSDGAWSAIRK